MRTSFMKNSDKLVGVHYTQKTLVIDITRLKDFLDNLDEIL